MTCVSEIAKDVPDKIPDILAELRRLGPSSIPTAKFATILAAGHAKGRAIDLTDRQCRSIRIDTEKINAMTIEEIESIDDFHNVAHMTEYDFDSNHASNIDLSLCFGNCWTGPGSTVNDCQICGDRHQICSYYLIHIGHTAIYDY